MNVLFALLLILAILLVSVSLMNILPPGANFVLWLVASFCLVASGMWIAALLSPKRKLATAQVRTGSR